MNSLILSTATRLLMPLILALSVFVFFRGHNAPGGGFVGGLLAATAFALLEKAEGLPRRAGRCASIRSRSRRSASAARSPPASGAGSAYGALPQGRLAARHRRRRRAASHGLPIGSILLFDFGVYLVVLGTVCGILFALEEVVATEADQGGTDAWRSCSRSSPASWSRPAPT